MSIELNQNDFTLACPIPINEYPQVLMAHGGGGKLMHNLIGKMFMETFSNPLLDEQHDGAVFSVGEKRLAFTTDSHVVKPLFYPGGDIGSLSVHGTVNDLAMCGARPLFLSLGMIIEEGLPMEHLWQVVQSIKAAAEASKVQIATGDTKVVDKGKGDGLFTNTTGIGIIEHNQKVTPSSVQSGDLVILSGDIGRHGIAIMASREGLAFETIIESDSAPLASTVLSLFDENIEVHCLRDLTRGGLASALIEIAQTTQLHIHIDEKAVPVREDVRGACEILGLDPFYVANEGRFIAFIPQQDAERTLEILHNHPFSTSASIIGKVDEDKRGLVTLRSGIGATRIVDMLSGEQLPRIC